VTDSPWRHGRLRPYFRRVTLFKGNVPATPTLDYCPDSPLSMNEAWSFFIFFKLSSGK
jgi:hypothetical protein